MWSAGAKYKITMAEGDYGIDLPITVRGVSIGTGDTILFTFKSENNGGVILTKEYSSISGNTVNLSFTAGETALFAPGNYVYSMDWYHNGEFQCNIILSAVFRVEDKA